MIYPCYEIDLLTILLIYDYQNITVPIPYSFSLHDAIFYINFYILEIYTITGFWMQKDELIQLHAFLLQVRTYMGSKDEEEETDAFTDYDMLSTGPQHVFKSKDEQKLAVFELSRGLATLGVNGKENSFQRVVQGFDQIIKRIRKNK